HLEVRGERRGSFAAFLEPRRAIAGCRPQAAALPSGVRIVDAAVEPLRVEAHRIRHAQDDHLAVLEGDQPVVLVTGRHGNVRAQARGVVLIDPAVIARLGAVVADTFEPRTGILVERPALRAMIAGRLRSAQWRLALAAIEAAKVAAGKRDPHDTLGIDVAAAHAEARRGHVI